MQQPKVSSTYDGTNSSTKFQWQDDGDWGFGPAITLINALSVTQSPNSTDLAPLDHYDKPASADSHQLDNLGFLNRVWSLLGKPPEVTFPRNIPSLTCDAPQTPLKEDKIKGLNEKGVRWQDQEKRLSLENKDAEAGKIVRLKSSKTQRKKENRRRKRELGVKFGAGPFTPPTSSDDDSEDESVPWQRSNERRSIIQQLVCPTSPKHDGHLASEDLLANKLAYPLSNPSESIAQNGNLVLPSYVPPHCRLVSIQAPKPVMLQSLATATTKKSKLMKMLQAKFVEDRLPLSKLSATRDGPRSDTVDIPNNIHVFVDASNIMIGFHDSLKLTRGLSPESRIRRQPLSFHNLSLILERGRPTAKRVLVGSDNFSAIQEAKLLGYETNILDRVHKAKELTPRQKRWRNRNLIGTSGPSSGSETATATHTSERWVEQGVDEILHLKMLESLVDVKSPSTIVLATGDAAQAEYSQGFLKMVERALERGWKVELVSFRHNTSGAYKKAEFRSQWGKSFKTIELDEFVEELVGA